MWQARPCVNGGGKMTGSRKGEKRKERKRKTDTDREESASSW